MGFSLIFMRMTADEQLDADRAGLAAFLEKRGLEVAPSTDNTHHLADSTGQLTFDGYWTDLHLDPLDQEGPVSGGLWHASLSEQECEFIYELCVAGRLLIVNPQGSPDLVVPGHNHEPSDLQSSDNTYEVAWVDSPDQLTEALTGGFQAFVEYRRRVIG